MWGGTFYIPPNSIAQVWEDIEQSIDLALTCNIDIIVTGDFNVNLLRNTSNDRLTISLKLLLKLEQLRESSVPGPGLGSMPDISNNMQSTHNIGRFCPRALTVKKKRRLSLFDLVCFALLLIHGILAFRIAIVLCFVFSPKIVN
jgi:hypothetical protein